MTTNTAAKICVLIKVIAMVTGLILIWSIPESLHCPGSLDFCEYFKPWRFWLYTPPFLITMIIVLVVIVFTMYRAHTFREINFSSPPQDEIEMEERNNTSSPDSQLEEQNDNVFVAWAETETGGNVREGETLSMSLRNYPMGIISCPVPPLTSMLDILYKYLRVTLLSLCILAGNLTEHIMIITNFASNSGQCCHRL